MKFNRLNIYIGRICVLLIIGIQVVSANKIDINPAGLGVVTVGPSNNCDYNTANSSIQDAIDDLNGEIRIAGSGTHAVNLLINNKSVILRGGYVDCTAAANGISNNNRPTLDGQSLVVPVIRILGSSQVNQVSLENLIITKGQGAGFATGGGISTYQADLALHIENVLITENTGLFGGGLAIIGGNVNASLMGVVINDNSAPEGGGLFCTGDNVSVIIEDGVYLNSNISENAATAGDGGGMLLRSGCEVSTFSGFAPNSPKTKGVFDNTATKHGGGVAVESGSEFNAFGYEVCIGNICYGNNSAPVSVVGNIADFDSDQVGSGGGVYVFDAEALMENSVINNNQAPIGAGLSAYFSAVSIYARNGQCWSTNRCSQISNNIIKLPGQGFGGAVYLNNSIANISTSYITGNRADFGTAIYSTNSDAILEGNMIVQNGGNDNALLDNYSVFAAQGSDIGLRYSTVADNHSNLAVFRLIEATLSLQTSIIHESSGIDVISLVNSGVAADCIMAHEISNLPIESNISLDDPEFVDRLNGNFHLNAAISPAIDFCNQNVAPLFNDIDNQSRGWDDPHVNNGVTNLYDLGADESYGSDVIFEDGFEG